MIAPNNNHTIIIASAKSVSNVSNQDIIANGEKSDLYVGFGGGFGFIAPKPIFPATEPDFMSLSTSPVFAPPTQEECATRLETQGIVAPFKVETQKRQDHPRSR
jgi:hypothetical protein